MALFEESAIALEKAAKALSASGAAYAMQGQLDHAIADFDAAIRLDPKYAACYFARANARYRKDQYDGAIADYDEAIRLDPKNAIAFFTRGCAYDDKGQHDRAIADFDEAIRLDPNFTQAINIRAKTIARKNELGGETSAKTLMASGRAYASKDQYDRAIAKMRSNRPRVPEGVRIYAIGDVHGCAELLDQVVLRIDVHEAAHPALRSVEIFLGDYIDRGPASREVLERLIARSRAREMVCLKGNHETFVEGFLNDPGVLSDWRNYGGLETLLSYGLAPSVKMNPAEQARLAAAFTQALPLNHRLFLGDLRPSFTCGDYFFVHAGVQPGIPLEEQHEEDLLWIREDFLLCEADFSKIVVHGHTPVREPDIRPNRINIDTGAYASGELTCLMLEGDERHFI